MHASSLHDRREITGYIQPTIPPPRVLRLGPFQDELTRALAARIAEVRGRLVVIDPMPGAAAQAGRMLAGLLARTAPRSIAALGTLLGGGYEDISASERPSRLEMVVFRPRASDPQLSACVDPELSEFDVVIIDDAGDGELASRSLHRWIDRMRRGGVVLVRGARTPSGIEALDEWTSDPSLDATWPTGSDLCVLRVGPRKVPGRAHARFTPEIHQA